MNYKDKAKHAKEFFSKHRTPAECEALLVKLNIPFTESKNIREQDVEESITDFFELQMIDLDIRFQPKP